MGEALETVKNGATTGVLHFHRNFSKQLQLRLDEGKDASNKTIEDSELVVHLDMSSMLVHIIIKKKIKLFLQQAMEVYRVVRC
jgi:hypothetical protein